MSSDGPAKSGGEDPTMTGLEQVDVTVWLRERGLEVYAATFVAQNIDVAVLPELDDEHFKELGVTVGHRILLRKAIHEMRAAGAPPVQLSPRGPPPATVSVLAPTPTAAAAPLLASPDASLSQAASRLSELAQAPLTLSAVSRPAAPPRDVARTPSTPARTPAGSLPLSPPASRFAVPPLPQPVFTPAPGPLSPHLVKPSADDRVESSRRRSLLSVASEPTFGTPKRGGDSPTSPGSSVASARNLGDVRANSPGPAVSIEDYYEVSIDRPPSAVSSEEERVEYMCKVIVVGDVGTGKTSLIQRVTTGAFEKHYKATIGVDFCLQELLIDRRTTVFLQLWDIAGQERFTNLTRMYYTQARGAFIVFDVTRDKTFQTVLKWKEDIDQKVRLPNGDPLPVILLANKCDLLERSPSGLDEFCQKHGFSKWLLTSARDGTGIHDATEYLVRLILAADAVPTIDETPQEPVLTRRRASTGPTGLRVQGAPLDTPGSASQQQQRGTRKKDPCC